MFIENLNEESLSRIKFEDLCAIIPFNTINTITNYDSEIKETINFVLNNKSEKEINNILKIYTNIASINNIKLNFDNFGNNIGSYYNAIKLIFEDYGFIYYIVFDDKFTENNNYELFTNNDSYYNFLSENNDFKNFLTDICTLISSYKSNNIPYKLFKFIIKRFHDPIIFTNKLLKINNSDIKYFISYNEDKIFGMTKQGKIIILEDWKEDSKNNFFRRKENNKNSKWLESNYQLHLSYEEE